MAMCLPPKYNGSAALIFVAVAVTEFIVPVNIHIISFQRKAVIA